jgi:hypothetical protein
VKFLAQYPEFVEQSAQMKTFAAWSHFQLGNFPEATALLARLRSERDDGGDRTLEVNLAISSGNWNSLLSHTEHEWTKRADRTPRELLRSGQLAAYLGSARSKDLIYAAAENGSESAEILLGCYGTAVSSGWEDDPQVARWLDAAAALSGDQGPVQRMSLRQMVELQPDWNRRETETWQQLNAGTLPMFGAGHLLNRSLVSLFFLPALANPVENDLRRRSIVFAYCGNRPQMLVSVKTLVLDATALLTFSLLGITTQIFSSFESIIIAHSTMGWLFDERRSIQFHQPSRVKRVRELKRYLDEGALKKFTPSTSRDHDLAAEIGDDLADLLAEAGSRDSDDIKQYLVVKPYPVHRISSMMEETVDLTEYQSHLCGCQDVVDALVRRGQLTTAEEQRARSYLKANEMPWPHVTSIADNATLYLDEVTLSYFQHLALIPKLCAAGFTAFVAEAESSERDALLRYESLTLTATTLLDGLRQELAEGIASGKVRLSPVLLRSDDNDEDAAVALRNHPTGTILHAAPMADALVIDDRAINQHQFIAVESGRKPLLTSFDVLEMLHRNGALDERTLLEHVTKLRQAGFCFIPVRAEELVALVLGARAEEGKLVETAELKSVRESILRARMTDALQLPKEHIWLAGMSDACLQVLKGQWRDNIDDGDARARSNWLLELLDWRGWMHRIPGTPNVDDSRKGRLRIMQLLTAIDGQSVAVNRRYWKWLEDDVLESIRNEEREAFQWLMEQAKALIAHAVTHGEDILAKDNEN